MFVNSQNQVIVNPIGLAAKENDVKAIKRLLKHGNHINIVDIRGWAAIHEAAANDSSEALEFILSNQDTRPLVETLVGETALYLACKNQCSMKIINCLLRVENITNHVTNEMVSPLHVVCGQGRLEAAETLIQAGAFLDFMDIGGHTPLHEAVRGKHAPLVALLLHAGAEPSLRKSPFSQTPFLLACDKGSLACIKEMLPFVSDVDERANDSTGLMIAVENNCFDVAKYLLENGANPNLQNIKGVLPLFTALKKRHSEIFNLLLPVTDPSKITIDLVNNACAFYKLLHLDDSSEFNYGAELYNCFFFDCKFIPTYFKTPYGFKPRYTADPPLSYILEIIEPLYLCSAEMSESLLLLLLSKGVGVNPLEPRECPALVYLHLHPHEYSHLQVIEILVRHGCNVDFITKLQGRVWYIPDAIIVSIVAGGLTLPILLTYSIHVEPDNLIEYLLQKTILVTNYDCYEVILKILAMCYPSKKMISFLNKQQVLRQEYQKGEMEPCTKYEFEVPSLQHLCRYIIRNKLRRKVNDTKEFLILLKMLPLPPKIQLYLRFM